MRSVAWQGGFFAVFAYAFIYGQYGHDIRLTIATPDSKLWAGLGIVAGAALGVWTIWRLATGRPVAWSGSSASVSARGVRSRTSWHFSLLAVPTAAALAYRAIFGYEPLSLLALAAFFAVYGVVLLLGSPILGKTRS